MDHPRTQPVPPHLVDAWLRDCYSLPEQSDPNDGRRAKAASLVFPGLLLIVAAVALAVVVTIRHLMQVPL